MYLLVVWKSLYLEVYLKRLFYVFVLCCLIGCSSSKPDITSTSISDDKPVIGQRIYLQVYGITDNPPMQFVWSADEGELQGDDETYWTYWITPEETGTYTITCTISDDGSEDETAVFTLSAVDRTTQTILAGPDSDEEVICMARNRTAKLGGIWAVVRDQGLEYFSASSETESEWDGNFNALAVETESSYYTALTVIWGAQDNQITKISTDGESIITCETCSAEDSINVLELDGSILWVGADSGLHKYDTSSAVWDEGIPVSFPDKVYDIFNAEDLTYVATSTGLYTIDDEYSIASLDSGLATAVMVEDSVTVWNIIDGAVTQDGVILDEQPPSITDSLDIDLLDRIWCGKYYWDGSAWQDPTGIDEVEDPIIESMVSPEGLLYLRSDSGKLFVWGKTP